MRMNRRGKEKEVVKRERKRWDQEIRERKKEGKIIQCDRIINKEEKESQNWKERINLKRQCMKG